MVMVEHQTDVKTAALPTRIEHFAYEWAFLSNFYPAEVKLWIDKDGVIFAHEIPDPASVEIYASVEHGYQAAKDLDAKRRWIFQLANNPRLTAGNAKKLGKEIEKSGRLRADWRDVNKGIMLDLLRQKFAYSILKRKLLSTFGAYLEEGNWWHDTFWGVCKGKLEGRVCRHGEHEPVGENNLGLLLAQVRTEVSGVLPVENPSPSV